jgi:16S rRNA (cytosine967-C5)-methyltransferase
MSRWTSYVQSAETVIKKYTGETPLAPVLKEYFRTHKQMGSTDRRYVSDLVYGYYRLGHAARDLPIDERLLAAYHLCHRERTPLIDALRPDWATRAAGSPEEKMAAFSWSPTGIFPWTDELSVGIDPLGLAFSHLIQPALYIRVRPGYANTVRNALQAQTIAYEEVGPDTWMLPSQTALQTALAPGKAYVVQDRSSQQVGDLLRQALEALGSEAPRVWDCCAASGGKSILLKDILPTARLTVSDIRTSILHNLDKRFEEAGIHYERAFAADLTRPLEGSATFDLVVADVPCSGSGTWSRTPEQLFFFEGPQIGVYAQRQQSILRHALTAVRPGGYLLLVTCSVFAQENESNVALLKADGCSLLTQQVFAGYRDRADTLFGALLQRL